MKKIKNIERTIKDNTKAKLFCPAFSVSPRHPWRGEFNQNNEAGYARNLW
jgi:hypothetical protein